MNVRRAGAVFVRALVVVLAMAAVSCSSGFLGERTGTIVIASGPVQGARALDSGWPMGDDTLPVFSTLIVLVRGPGMNTLVKNIDLAADPSPLSLEIKAGQKRSVNVVAIPDWPATRAKYPNKDIPDLVTSFTGGTTVDIPADTIVPVSIELVMASTKILVPDFMRVGANGPEISVSDTISGTPVGPYGINGLSRASNFVFGDHGRLFVSTTSGVQVYASLSQTPIQTISFGQDYQPGKLALCKTTKRLYLFTDNEDYNSLQFVNLLATETVVNVNLPGEYTYRLGGLAVDGAGYVYLPANFQENGEGSTEFILLKLRIVRGAQDAWEAQVVGEKSYEALNIGYNEIYIDPETGVSTSQFVLIDIQDMTVIGGTLYIAASEVYTTSYPDDLSLARSRGKIISVDTATMTVLYEAGWSGGKYPTPDSTQLYGPVRFVGLAPRKLYILDEGGVWDGETYSGYGYSDIDRVVELDLDGGVISAVGLSGTSEMYERYDQIFIC